MHCHPHYVLLLHTLLPENSNFPTYATQKLPHIAEGWFWQAELNYAVLKGNQVQNLSAEERSRTIEYFVNGLSLDPKDGLRWRELGDLLKMGDPQTAIQAYLQSCFNGDPAYNGCWLAGKTAEQIGEIENAIQYYRYSRWEVARDRAGELEVQLTDQK